MRLDDLLNRANTGMRARHPSAPGARVVQGLATARVCDVTEDSRTVLPGSLFVARAGAKADGRQFIGQALKAGACAVLCAPGSGVDLIDLGSSPARAAVVEASDVGCAAAFIAEAFYGNPSFKLRTIGVTGTNGKTTTTWILWRLLNSAENKKGHGAGLIGTVVIDDGNEVARAEMTTPPAIEISRTMSVMVENGCRFASMEVSSHSLAQKRVAALDFKVGVFTNLTQDHLDFHKTMQAYGEAKAELFSMLAPEGLAVVNVRDPASAVMLRGCRARVCACVELAPGEAPVREGASVRIVEMDRTGMRLALTGPFGEVDARVGLIGSFNAMNVLQAVVCAHECGVSAPEITRACASLDAPPGRLERVPTREDEPLVLVDFAHTEDGLRNALGTVKRVKGAGRLIAVFGCGGDKDRTKRPKMGKVASEIADLAVITSDNPRTERPGDIIDAVLSGVSSQDRAKVTVQADRRRAIQHALSLAAASDIVVIAGKGHETEQILPDGRGGTETHHFDDREAAKEALAERRAALRVTTARNKSGATTVP